MSDPSIISLHHRDVAYRMAGDGDDAILFIHGMAGSSDTWRHVMPTMARDHVVIAPDLPGHGRSAKLPGDYSLGAAANSLRDLLIGLDAGPVTVVGQSLGGGVAMQFAYQHPELCERLVLVSSGGLGREVNLLLRLLSVPGAEAVLSVAAPWFVRDAGNAVRHWLGDRGVRADRLDEMWRAYDSLGDGDTRRAFLRTLRSVIDIGGQAVNAEDRLYLTSEMPTLVIWGDDDKIIPVAHAEHAREAMPAARIEILEGVGHFPQIEVPTKVIELLSEFISGTEPAALDASMYRDRLLQSA
ncbi:MAG TPA: alpha/beta fold hydrolase [Acidimicrobiales bacterium]|nr:alpha/beta fold hydrolase [Acidimicrobiales bacterium]